MADTDTDTETTDTETDTDTDSLALDDLPQPKFTGTVPPSDLTTDNQNPNELSDDQFELLQDRIQERGWIGGAIITDTDGLIADGEHRWKAAKALGLEAVPVKQLVLTDAQRRLIRQELNKIAGEHDDNRDAAEFDTILSAGYADDLEALIDTTDDDLEGLLNDVNDTSADDAIDTVDTDTADTQAANDPYDEWDSSGGADYDNDDKTSEHQIKVHFKNMDDVQAFADMLDYDRNITESTRSIWFPELGYESFMDKRYVAADDAEPETDAGTTTDTDTDTDTDTTDTDTDANAEPATDTATESATDGGVTAAESAPGTTPAATPSADTGLALGGYSGDVPIAEADDYAPEKSLDLADVRRDIVWNQDADAYTNRKTWWFDDAFDEIDALGYDFDRNTDLDYWREQTRERWDAADPQTNEEIFQFYRTNRPYIPELSLWTYEGQKVPAMRLYHEWFVQSPDITTVLDYGAGIGTVVMYLNQYLDATYTDVGGVLQQYYEDRMEARDISYPDPVTVDPNTEPDLPAVDALVTNDVLEHVPDPAQTAQTLIDTVTPGGYLVTQWTFSDQDNTPCHLHGDSSGVYDVFRDRCTKIFSGYNGFVHLWQRRPSDTSANADA